MTSVSECRRPFAVLALAAGFLLAACNGVHYVDHSGKRPETAGAASGEADAFGRQVDFALKDSFFRSPVDCVMVLPTKGSEEDADVRAVLESAVTRHLTTRFTKVIGPRRVRSLARKLVYDPAHSGDLRHMARRLRCDGTVRIKSPGLSETFVVVWAHRALSVKLELTRARDGELLWWGAHKAERSDGSLPISPFGAAAGALYASALVSDQDQLPSMADDVVRRILASLPDLRSL